jgi:hypothetical protein
MSKSKVVYLGCHKTGTTSMGKLFSTLGLNCSGPWHVKGWKDEASVKKALEFANGYDAFQDHPWPIIYKPFDKKFPNSKFIFSERDVDEWYKSALKHFQTESTLMREYIYGKGNGCPQGNEKIYKEVYLQHSRDVLQYFRNRPTDFLYLNDMSDRSAQKIGKFLGYTSYADLEMPHKNKHCAEGENKA